MPPATKVIFKDFAGWPLTGKVSSTAAARTTSTNFFIALLLLT
jgi:hypothetical protein